MRRIFILAISGAILVVFLTNINWQSVWDKFAVDISSTTPAAMPEAAAPYQSSVDYENAVMRAVEKVSPSVVSIIISKNLPVIEQCLFNIPPEFQPFFGDGQFSRPCQKGTKLQEVGGGSGFIVSLEGLIITNKHVVSDKEAIYAVLTNDGKKYEAKVVARDPVQDLALIQITKPVVSDLPVVRLGNSDSVRLGQSVIAIGNALSEFRNTVSIGIISGLSRSITASGGGQSEFLEGLIQTDAGINPGNSGGPLVNLRGEVIGMNVAIASGAENIGFAIPINRAKHDIESFKASGKIQVPYLGVRYLNITEEMAKKEKLPVEKGIIVKGNQGEPAVIKDSPAAKAGIKAEDIILSVNGEAVNLENSLAAIIQKYKVGDILKLKIIREEKEIEVLVKLEERKFN